MTTQTIQTEQQFFIDCIRQIRCQLDHAVFTLTRSDIQNLSDLYLEKAMDYASCFFRVFQNPIYKKRFDSIWKLIQKIRHSLLRLDSTLFADLIKKVELSIAAYYRENQTYIKRAVAPSYRIKINAFKSSKSKRITRGFRLTIKGSIDYLSNLKRSTDLLPLSSLFDSYSYHILKSYNLIRLGQLRYAVKTGLLKQYSKHKINWPDGAFCSFGIPLTTEAKIIETLEYYYH